VKDPIIQSSGARRLRQQLERGSGDYTAERACILGNPTLQEVAGEIKRLRRAAPKRA